MASPSTPTCGGHGTQEMPHPGPGGSVPVSRLDWRSPPTGPGRLAVGLPGPGDQRLVRRGPAAGHPPEAPTVGWAGRSSSVPPSRSGMSNSPSRARPTSAPTVRLLDAVDDLGFDRRLHALRRLPGVLRAADFKVTAVVVDDACVDVEAGDTTERDVRPAVDFGTTTGRDPSRPHHRNPGERPPMLNQQLFGADVITRISATMMDPTALDRLRQAATDTLTGLAADVCRDGRGRTRGGLRGRHCRQCDDGRRCWASTPSRSGSPVHQASATWPTAGPPRSGSEPAPGARVVLIPALGAYVGGDIVAGMLAAGMDRDKRTRLFIDVGTNCEIVLSDGRPSSPPPRRPGRPSRAARSGAACAPPMVRSRSSGSVRMSPSRSSVTSPRSGCAAPGWSDAVAEPGQGWPARCVRALRHRRGRRDARAHPRPRLTSIGQERVFVLHSPPQRRRRRTASTSPSATSAAAVRQGRHRHRLGAAARGSSASHPRRPAGPPRRLVRLLSLGRLSGADRAGPLLAASAADRLGRQCRRRGRRWPCSGRASGPARPPCSRRCAMSSSPTGPTSTTGSSTTSPSPGSRRVGPRRLCGAIAAHCSAVAAESGWTLDVHPLPPLLHNHPDRIAAAVEDLVTRLRPACTTSSSWGTRTGTMAPSTRSASGCPSRACRAALLRPVCRCGCRARPHGGRAGTYLFTDFLVKSFDRTVIRELGLDRYPELREAYFGNYRSVVWLTQNEDPGLRKAADAAAEALGLPLTVRHTGLAGLTAALRDLVQARPTERRVGTRPSVRQRRRHGLECARARAAAGPDHVDPEGRAPRACSAMWSGSTS